MKKKLHAGNIPMSGVKYKFMKYEDACVKLYLTIGVDIQKQFKIKRGDRLLLEFDKKNPNKIVVSKTKSKERGTYSVLQHAQAKCVHICPTWKYKKPPASAFKVGKKARVKTRKNGFSIELIN